MWLVGLQFDTNGSGPLPRLFHAGVGLLFAVRVDVVGVSVLRLVRLDGWMKGIGSALDLEVEGVV